jgi:hypothetical protein
VPLDSADFVEELGAQPVARCLVSGEGFLDLAWAAALKMTFAAIVTYWAISLRRMSSRVTPGSSGLAR